MLVMYLCVRGIDVGHVIGLLGYRCWSCICVCWLSMVVMYLFVRGIDVCYLSVCEGYRC